MPHAHHLDLHDKNPRLPLLSSLVSQVPEKIFSDVLLVSVQHGLHSTVDLFKSFLQLGVKEKNIFWLGKSYSSNVHVQHLIKLHGIQTQRNTEAFEIGCFSETFEKEVDRVWRDVTVHLEKHQDITKIIVLDDGGVCLNRIPQSIVSHYPIAGVEQTASGINASTKGLPFPVVNVAETALKKHIETPLIAESIAQALMSRLSALGLDFKTLSVGIVGCGDIGSAVADCLQDAKALLVHDIDHKKHYRSFGHPVEQFNEIFAADLIIGCAGKDITAGYVEAFMSLKGEKILVSCSSRDVEFMSLLQCISKQQPTMIKNNQDTPYHDLQFLLNAGQLRLTVLNSGFPINFDKSLDAGISDTFIQGTRALMLAGALCANSLIDNPETQKPLEKGGNIHQVSAVLQQSIAQAWRVFLPAHLYTTAAWSIFDDVSSIVQHSKGHENSFCFA